MDLRLRKHYCHQHSIKRNRHRQFLSPTILWMLLVLSLSNLALRVQAQTLKAESQQALKEALADEYQARAFYQAVLDKFGQVRPFSNIVHSEDRHAALVEELLVKYGIPIPEDTYQGKLKAPESLLAACEAGVKSEIANRELYDRWLSKVEEPDLRAVFIKLRDASQNNHLPAFERCQQRLSFR